VADILAKAQIVTQSLRTDERKVLRTGGNDARFVPGTQTIAYMSGTKLMSVPFNLKQLEISGSPTTVVESVLSGSAIGTAQFAYSSTGMLAYIPAPAAEYELAYMDLNGMKKSIGTLPSTVFAPRVSPDGKQLTIDTSSGANSAIWLIDLPGPAKMRRFTMDGENHFPLWSADGLRLLFISVRNEQPAIYEQLANGTGATDRLTETARAPESYSAVNQTLSFITLNTAGGNADYDVWTYSFRDKTSAPLIQVKSSAQHSSRFSPDGKWIAYVSDETGRLELYVQPFPTTGGRFQITKNGGGHPLWSPDGKKLYFDNSGRMFSVGVQTQPGFTAGDPAPLPVRGFIQGQGNVRRQYDITPDGTQFIMMFAPPQEIRTR
jgi:Tol biopolymer transport system component